MIGYVTLGTNDVDRAIAFYDGVFQPMEAKRFAINERITLWSRAKGEPMLGISIPFDGEAATSGNGTMVAVNVGDKAMVDSVYGKALEAGGQDEGAPGRRGNGNFYGGYFRDPDGNKLVVYCMN